MKTYTVSITLDTKQTIIRKVEAESRIIATRHALNSIKDSDWTITGDLITHAK